MMPNMKSSMGSKSMPMDTQSMGMSDEQDKSGKLLALQNLLGSIAELSDDDMRPYIEQAQQSLHMAHESTEGDKMGVDDAENSMMDNDSMDQSKPAMDISVGMGTPSNDMSEDDHKPKGFLAILAKKVAKK